MTKFYFSLLSYRIVYEWEVSTVKKYFSNGVQEPRSSFKLSFFFAEYRCLRPPVYGEAFALSTFHTVTKHERLRFILQTFPPLLFLIN